MRTILSTSLVGLASRPDFVFLTGDLGFGALEPLRDVAGERFINAGIAEQNMISVASGLGRMGFAPWVYSIAPFIYARPFEQIRNDVCLHRLPVYLIGNGGGYGYGVMGATHHALEDYGVLCTLSGLRAYVPAFASDVPVLIARILASRHPAYLRLGLDELPPEFDLPQYAPWRHLLAGDKGTMVIVGTLAGSILGAVRELPVSGRPSVWIISELPVQASEIPAAFLTELRASGQLMVVEEHVAAGGAGQMLVHALALLGESPQQFTHRTAQGYPSGRYGSQAFHRKECGLDPGSIMTGFRG